MVESNVISNWKKRTTNFKHMFMIEFCTMISLYKKLH